MKATAKEINILLSKITKIDPENGNYIKRHLRLNLTNKCFEYVGAKTILNRIFEKLKDLK